MFPSSHRAEAPKAPTPPPGHPPFCLSRMRPAGVSSCFTEQVHLVSPGASEATEHNTRSGHNKVFSRRPEKSFRLQVLQQHVLPEGRVPRSLTRVRAREGSLRSSTLLWDPYRCSRAARSVGKTEEKSVVRERDGGQHTRPVGAQVSPAPKCHQGTLCNQGGCSARNANKGHEKGQVPQDCFFYTH